MVHVHGIYEFREGVYDNVNRNNLDGLGAQRGEVWLHAITMAV